MSGVRSLLAFWVGGARRLRLFLCMPLSPATLYQELTIAAHSLPLSYTAYILAYDYSVTQHSIVKVSCANGGLMSVMAVPQELTIQVVNQQLAVFASAVGNISVEVTQCGG